MLVTLVAVMAAATSVGVTPHGEPIRRESLVETPESAMRDAQRLLDDDDKRQADDWHASVIALGGSDAEAAWFPAGHQALTQNKEQEPEETDGGDYVLLLMQQDLSHMASAQEKFSGALSESDDVVKQIAPHVPQYDAYTGGAYSHAGDATDDEPEDDTLDLMQHDMVLLQQAEDSYSAAVGTMERTAAEVKKHEDLYADFVKAIETHQTKASKLTLGTSALGPQSLTALKDLVTMISGGAAALKQTADQAKARGVAPSLAGTSLAGKLRVASLAEVSPTPRELRHAESLNGRHEESVADRLRTDLERSGAIVASVAAAHHHLLDELNMIPNVRPSRSKTHIGASTGPVS